MYPFLRISKFSSSFTHAPFCIAPSSCPSYTTFLRHHQSSSLTSMALRPFLSSVYFYDNFPLFTRWSRDKTVVPVMVLRQDHCSSHGFATLKLVHYIWFVLVCWPLRPDLCQSDMHNCRFCTQQCCIHSHVV